MPPKREYPEFTTMPPTTRPGPSINRRCLHSVYGVERTHVLKSYRICRLGVIARRCRPMTGNTTPGRRHGRGLRGLQPEGASSLQTIGGAYQTLLPSEMRSAVNPPPCWDQNVAPVIQRILGGVRPATTSRRTLSGHRSPCPLHAHGREAPGNCVAMRTCHSSAPFLSDRARRPPRFLAAAARTSSAAS